MKRMGSEGAGSAKTRNATASAHFEDLAAPMSELIGFLLSERPESAQAAIPESRSEQWALLRALMNMRQPAPLPASVLALQDAVLQELRGRRGTVDAEAIARLPNNPRLALWQGDITALRIEAIVNAANSKLLGCFVPNHRCIDNAIHTFSGMQLRLACDKIMRARGCDEPTGTATVTPAFNLPAEHVIHTVGPIVADRPAAQHRASLASCYTACLEASSERGIRSIAFCCISTGEFRFPHSAAAEIAVRAVSDFLKNDTVVETVVFDVFSNEDRTAYERLLLE